MKRSHSTADDKTRAQVLVSVRGKRKRWTLDEEETLRINYPFLPAFVIAYVLQCSTSCVHNRARALGVEKSQEFHRHPLAHLWNSTTTEGSRASRFRPGQVPRNKGLRRPGWSPGRMAETQFKKGRPAHEARNYVPVGTEKYDRKRKVLMRKVTDDPNIFPVSRWRPVHVLVWEAVHGAVPPGHIVIFRPRMKTLEAAEITVDRLELVTLAENMRRNTIHNRYPPDVLQLIRTNAALKRSITCRERNQNEEQDGGRSKPSVRRAGKPGRPRQADGTRSCQGDQ
ncbi:MAG TPA: HNH endonuclease [Rubrivivax sp.]|nr:HNH endonuclease [Rubrivivax sp.]